MATNQSLPTPDNTIPTQGSYGGGTTMVIHNNRQMTPSYPPPQKQTNVSNGNYQKVPPSQNFQQPKFQQQRTLPPQRRNGFPPQQSYQNGQHSNMVHQHDSMEDSSEELVDGLTEEEILAFCEDDDDFIDAPAFQQQQQAQNAPYPQTNNPPAQNDLNKRAVIAATTDRSSVPPLPPQQQRRQQPPPQIPPVQQHRNNVVLPQPQTPKLPQQYPKRNSPQNLPNQHQLQQQHTNRAIPPQNRITNIVPLAQAHKQALPPVSASVKLNQTSKNLRPNQHSPQHTNFIKSDAHPQHKSPTSHHNAAPAQLSTTHHHRNAQTAVGPDTLSAAITPIPKTNHISHAAPGVAHQTTPATDAANQQRRKPSTSIRKRPKSVHNVTEHPSKRKRIAEPPKIIHVASGMEKNRLRTFQRLNLEHQDALLSMLRMGGDVKQRAGNETIALGELAEKLYRTITNISTNSGSPIDILPLLLECIKQSHSIRDTNLLSNALKILLTLHTESVEVREYVSKEAISTDIVVSAPRLRILFNRNSEQKCIDALDNWHTSNHPVSSIFCNNSSINAPPLLRISDSNGVELKQLSSTSVEGTNRLRALSIDVDDEIFDVADDESCVIDIASRSFGNSDDVMEIDETDCALFEQTVRLFQELMIRMDLCEKMLRVIIPLIDSMVHHASAQQLKVFMKLFTHGHVSQLLHSQYTSLITMGVGLLVPFLMKIPHALELCHSLQYQPQSQENKTESILQTVARIIHEVENKSFRDIRKRPESDHEKKENFFKFYVLRTEVLKLYSYVISGFADGIQKLCLPLEKTTINIPSLVCMLQNQLVYLLEEKSFPEHRIHLIRRIISILIHMGSVIDISRCVGTMEMELDSARSKLKWIDEQPEGSKVFTFDKRILAILDKNQ
eukprot:CAMPEP_0117437260 /NCGR_PEP_ID=MMETSP0759-20121206/1432_1 /TAXON_ID=63605 /ORGANISM="Percolomonas cosmopolitus, Strain WS" /LENGTH=896 /DNA_ID=CAMNT_0005228887 /DNA_START=436 /DNA_END=3126 /DNA_ORIENTATION=+